MDHAMATVLGNITQQYTYSLNNVMTKHGMGYKLVSEAHKENMSHYTDKQCYGQRPYKLHCLQMIIQTIWLQNNK